MTVHRKLAEGGGGGAKGRKAAARDVPAPTEHRLAEGVKINGGVEGEGYYRDPCCEDVVTRLDRVATAAEGIDEGTGQVAASIDAGTGVLVSQLATSTQQLVTASGSLQQATSNIATTLTQLPALATIDRNVSLRRSELENLEMAPLWVAITLRTEAISFPRYDDFMQRVLCGGTSGTTDPRTGETLRDQVARLRSMCHLPGVDIYDLLKTATEVFLLLECGVAPDTAAGRGRCTSGSHPLAPPGADREQELGTSVDRFATPGERTLTLGEAEEALSSFLGNARNNYLRTVILQNAFPGGEVSTASPFCVGDDMLLDRPCLLELIWSYWMEEGMLTQTISTLTRRFQNVRRPGRGPDPLTEFELDPLRPLSGFLWGYLQDEPNRLSVARRAYEYSHHYGLTLFGRAVPVLRPADPRSRFLEAFHNLLRQAAVFYREDNDTTVIADAFPVLNSLKETHLILAEGAHNQFRDLPWTARVEMLLQQWLLARPEMREFLRGRYMVAYPERWMGAVDSMKKLQGWTDTSVVHFRDLARFGERIILSIRYGNWSDVSDQDHAKAWLRYFKEEIQGYVHAYHTATGVNLSDDVVEVRERADVRYLQPSWHLRNRLLASRRATRQAR